MTGCAFIADKVSKGSTRPDAVLSLLQKKCELHEGSNMRDIGIKGGTIIWIEGDIAHG